MMATRMFAGAVLALVVSLSATASASPTEYYADEFVVPGAQISASYLTPPDLPLTPPGTIEGPFTYGFGGSTGGFTFTMPDVSHGGSFFFTFAPGYGDTLTGVDYIGGPAKAPFDGNFQFEMGPANQDGTGFAGDPIFVQGTAHGTIYGPSGIDGWMQGTLTGTATSASFFGDRADLPPALLDILNNPGHLHLSGVVTGANDARLGLSLTFDPPSPVPVPEPTTMATLIAGAAWLAKRHWRIVLHIRQLGGPSPSA